MKSNFKVGDSVICTDNEDGLLSITVDKIYTVIFISDDEEVFIYNDLNTLNGYYPTRFRLVTLLERELASVD